MANTKPTTREQLAEAFPAIELVAELIELVEDDYTRAKRAFEVAEDRRRDVRKKFGAFFPAGVDVDVDELGLILTRSMRNGRRTFSLTNYELTDEITPEMAKHIGRTDPSEHWKLQTQ